MAIHTHPHRAVRVAVAVVVAVVLSACGSGDDSMPGMGHSPSKGATTSATAGNDSDVMFAQMMIPHHQQAVEMAELAATRASDPEVKELAAKIKAAQAPEIATMTGWLTAWGKSAMAGHDVSSMGHGMPGMMSADDMAKLKDASGTAFDRQFVTMMIAHHEGAITMAKDEIAKGADAAAKALAEQIIRAQQSEIDQMKKILDRL